MRDISIRDLEKLLRKRGCEIKKGSSHRKVYLDGRLIAILPHNPHSRNGGRHMRNTVADLRRLGLSL